MYSRIILWHGQQAVPCFPTIVRQRSVARGVGGSMAYVAHGVHVRLPYRGSNFGYHLMPCRARTLAGGIQPVRSSAFWAARQSNRPYFGPHQMHRIHPELRSLHEAPTHFSHTTPSSCLHLNILLRPLICRNLCKLPL